MEKQSNPPSGIAPAPAVAAAPLQNNNPVAVATVLAQQQPLAPRATAPLSVPVTQYPPLYAHETPPIFQSVNLRRGKWTSEEEDYAEFVIQEFERGTLKKCENGTTLRAFLSRKLHCAPMRISKKYAGKNIGKLVFLAKTSITEAKLADVETKLRELEIKFYKSLYEEMRDGPHLTPHSYARYLPTAPQMTVSPMPIAPLGTFMPHPVILPATMAPVSHPVQQQQQLVIPPTTATQPSVVVPSSQPLQRQVVIPPNTQPNVVGVQPLQHPVVKPPNAMSQPPAMTAEAPPVATAVHTKQLQQAYLNAFNGQPLMPPTAAVASNNGTPVAQVPAVPFALPVPVLNDPKVVQVAAHAAASMPQKPHPVPPGVKITNATEVPDFLLGFEKVGGEEQRAPWMMPGAPLLGGFQGSGVPLQCSPPLTSRSFDDLHQMLGVGTDLAPVPLDLNAIKSEHGVSQGNVTNPMPATQQQPVVPNNVAAAQHTSAAAPNVSADIYATFAQQSALAVSQHSAYCRADKATSTESKGHVVAPTAAPADVSESLAAVYGGCHASVVNQANLRAHALSTQQQKPQAVISLKAKPQSPFRAPTRNIVSGSERSSDVGSTEDVGSMHGSTSSSNIGTSDTDSVSDAGPPRKKTKIARDAVSPVSSVRSSPRIQ